MASAYISSSIYGEPRSVRNTNMTSAFNASTGNGRTSASTSSSDDARNTSTRCFTNSSSSSHASSRKPRSDDVVERKVFNRIFVGGLNETINEDDLRALFGQFGMIKEVHLKDRGAKGQDESRRGHGFITYKTAAEAQEAVRLGAGECLQIKGIRLNVCQAIRRLNKQQISGNRADASSTTSTTSATSMDFMNGGISGIGNTQLNQMSCAMAAMGMGAYGGLPGMMPPYYAYPYYPYPTMPADYTRWPSYNALSVPPGCYLPYGQVPSAGTDGGSRSPSPDGSVGGASTYSTNCRCFGPGDQGPSSQYIQMPSPKNEPCSAGRRNNASTMSGHCEMGSFIGGKTSYDGDDFFLSQPEPLSHRIAGISSDRHRQASPHSGSRR